MKKLSYVFAAVVCAVVITLSFAACSDAGAPEHDVSPSPEYAISADDLAAKLDKFMAEGRFDRTTYSEEEKKAAEFIASELRAYGYTDGEENELIREFKTTESSGKTLTSQNVVATYVPDGADENASNVIIGAYYDNRYAVAADRSGEKLTKSQGALSNGTGVATLLCVAEWLQTEKPQIDFTVTVVFFGASAADSTGVVQYLNKQMTVAEKRNTVLMTELQRLGGDHLYAFSDHRKTKREPFFNSVAADFGLNVYKPTQKSPHIMGVKNLDGIPFADWAQSGCFSVFFNAGIPTLNLIGGNWETIDLTDSESGKGDDISFTERDTLRELKALYPDYAQKMATAATLTIRSMTADGFIDTMRYDKDNFPQTYALSTEWIWYLTVLVVLAAAGGLTMLICSRLLKKYRPEPVNRQVRNVKMAVFGMEYEDKKSGDIFIDLIKTPNGGNEIFPGVQNNDEPFGSTLRPFDPFGAVGSSGEESEDEKHDDGNDASN